MAKTNFATGNALTRKAWSEKLFRDTKKQPFFSVMMSTDSNSIVQEKTDLEGEQGDRVDYGIRMRLTTPGFTEGQTAEGNESSLTTYNFQLTLAQYRQAVRDSGAMSRKRVAFNLEEESKEALRDWGGEKIDQLLFDALGIGTGAATSPSKVFYLDSSGVVAAGSAATAKSGLHATNSKLTPGLVSAIKAWAKTGGGRNYVPMRPVLINKKWYYVMVVHPDCLYDFKQNSTYQNFMRDAAERGDENPLFTGAIAIIDGVIIHEHENCAVATDGGGGSVAWAKNAFMGAQALCWGWGRRPVWVEESFDYGNEKGFCWDIIAAAGRTEFNSLTYGSVGVWLARTNISAL